MKLVIKMLLFSVFLFSTAQIPLHSQESISDRIIAERPLEEKPFEFPQWAKDIRRVDIITFGVFPFAWFFSSLLVDLQRCAENDWNSAYYTSIGSSSNAIAWGDGEYIKTLCIAGALSVTVALVDLFIVKIKRSEAQKKAEAAVKNEPEIQRRPLNAVPLSGINSILPRNMVSENNAEDQKRESDRG
ncbi:MAG: hypothetical protein LBV68_03555 [Spirochaetaceae bacterium]|jgi:hypothetical protein|nr:hypothetical protein [Spirochaetaceae bacterium]